MDKQTLLEATSDSQPLICDQFIVNGHLANLCLYSTELVIFQKQSCQTIPIDFNFSYSIIQGKQGPIGLQFKRESQNIQCIKQSFSNFALWDEALVSLAICNGFHYMFRIVQKLGKGSFANVYLVEDRRRKRKVAVKVFNKKDAFKDKGKMAIQNEVRMMRMLRSKHLAQIYGVYQTPTSLYLSIQYVQGTTLSAYLKQKQIIPVQNRKKILRALLNGVEDMRKLKIVHRDIKPQNIIVSKDLQQIKIIDFGLATKIDQQKYIYLKCGTGGYMAPQIINSTKSSFNRLGSNSDVFSVGAIYYYILFGTYLFAGTSYQQIMDKNKECKFIVPQCFYSEMGQIELLKAMLRINPLQRVTPSRALNSNFLRQEKKIDNRAALE